MCTSLSGPTCLWTALPAWLPGSAHALRFVLRMTANAVTSSRYNVRVRWRMLKDGWLNGKSMGSSLGRLLPPNRALERNARPAASECAALLQEPGRRVVHSRGGTCVLALVPVLRPRFLGTRGDVIAELAFWARRTPCGRERSSLCCACVALDATASGRSTSSLGLAIRRRPA